METLAEAMSKEHEKVENSFDEFKKQLDTDFENSGKFFSKFKWSLEKHFFVEEKVFFILFEKIENQEVSDVFELMEDHGKMIELIKKIEDDLSEKIKPEVSELENTLKKHHNLEDDVLYPKLDKILSSEQKQEILERVKEVIRE
jgi:iron-sulfur cluster repair protein YtfE (RIC family)|tara:strand:+ start:42 stop:473 length:432 start_codon:yes stop_codon:yes gene_type:complete